MFVFKDRVAQHWTSVKKCIRKIFDRNRLLYVGESSEKSMDPNVRDERSLTKNDY